MGKIKDILSNRLIPTHALIFYKSSCETENGAYVEHREIKNGNFGVAEPLSVKMLSNIMKVVERYTKTQATMDSLHGTIPDNLLYVSSKIESVKLIWYRKPEKRMMYFAEVLDIPNGEMMIPGLVYVAEGRTLSVYAYKGSKPRRILYNAPFFNVGDSVCLGTAKVQKPTESTFENWIEYWETMFWKSEFAHILGANPVKGNLATITKKCISTGKPFPTDELIRLKKTLKDLLK